MRRFHWFLLLSPLLTNLAFADGPSVDFSKDVQPLLERSCWKCHGAEKQQGGLRLDRKESALGHGDSGATAIVPREAEKSELLRRIESTDTLERMPANADPLTPNEIVTFRKWIEQGAIWPEASPAGESSAARREMVVTEADRRHWSFQPLRPMAIPSVRAVEWPRNPIDSFIASALESQDLQPNPRATQIKLIRRVYFDLLGLPPTPDEVHEFLADTHDDAYDRLVDRVLASPHYGERWGRHWLDVARYADSDGLETDKDRPNAFPYRDFVIRAFNRDLPFDTFARWQLAGDEYEPDHPEALSATGFLAAAPTEMLMVPMEEEKLRLRFNELDDMAVTTISGFLGLTLGCARCHDHKFDPIPTRDYYRLQCAFTSTTRSDVLLTPREEANRYRALESEWKSRRDPAKTELDQWYAARKKEILPRLKNAKIATLSISDEQKRDLMESPDSDTSKELASRFGDALRVTDDEIKAAFDEAERSRWQNLKRQLDDILAAAPSKPPSVLGIVDQGQEPQPTFLLDRGDFYARKEPVSVGFLTVLTTDRKPEEIWSDAKLRLGEQRSTGQRSAIAEWISDPHQGAGALMARVFVNRVWRHHFGEGLVRTSGDFGVRGELPSHPELLEWLANEFVSSGWSVKHLHNLIVKSAVYQQSTDFDAARSEKDPNNRLLWRRRPMRIEAEILRDTIADVSGVLNTEQYGPAFKPPIPKEAMQARNLQDPYPVNVQDSKETRRRTVYMFHKRVVQHPMMQAFDAPDSAVTCSRRSSTTVAPQALVLLNDPIIRDRAETFAQRLLSETSGDMTALVERSFWLALSRPPSQSEWQASIAFLEAQVKRRAETSADVEATKLLALTDFCQALFSLNEFIYVD